MADKAYSPAAGRARRRRRGIKAIIPVKADQAAVRRTRGSAGGRPPTFESGYYKQRNTVELGQLRLDARFPCIRLRSNGFRGALALRRRVVSTWTV